MAAHTSRDIMRIVARIRPLLALLLCFGSLLLAVPAGAATPEGVQQAAPSSPMPESETGTEAPCLSDDGSEGEPDADARRRLCELNLGPAAVRLGERFDLEALRLRKEDRRSCRPPN